MSAVRDIATLARASAPQTERERRLPDPLVAALRGSGLMLAGAPEEVGGLELPPAAALRVAEAIARGDASAGWCVSIAVTSSLLAAYLPDASRGELFGDARADRRRGVGAARQGRGRSTAASWSPAAGPSAAGSPTPTCCSPAASSSAARTPSRAMPSVIAHPASRPRGPRHLAHARPARHRQPRCRRRRGVRARRAHVLAVRRPGRRPPAVPLSDLRLLRALDRRGRAGQRARSDRRVRRAGGGQGRHGLDAARWPSAPRPRRRSPRPRRRCAQRGPRTTRRSTRPGRPPRRDEPVPVELRNGLRLAATHAVRTSADVVRVDVRPRRRNARSTTTAPLQRRFRDAHTATAHFQVNAASRELPGRILLGQPADTSTL